MPSLIGHSLVGAALGKTLIKPREKKGKVIFLSILCANAPDFDVFFHHLNLDHIEILAHRSGFFHSLFFALIIAFLVIQLFFKENKIKYFFYFTLICFSHSLFDAMTEGIGVSFFYPFIKKEFLLPFTPLLPAGFTIKEFIGSGALFREVAVLWVPAIILLIAARLNKN